MSVTSVVTDPEAKTMTLTAEFEASVERVWEIWADPRKLERWWGPPTYPATVEEHDLNAGGSVTYYMTGRRARGRAGGGRSSRSRRRITSSSRTASPTTPAIPIRRCRP